MKQHKWHKEIKAWADGEDIESKYGDEEWGLDTEPDWLDEDLEYRIKPQPKEPQYLYVNMNENGIGFDEYGDSPNCIGKIKLEVDE